MLKAGQGRVLTTGDGVTNGLTFQVAAPTALEDAKKSAAVKDYLERLRRAYTWVYSHEDEWAKVWAKETGLPEDVALAAVKRTYTTRIPVAVDEPIIASEQEIADTFTELKLIPDKVDFGDFTDSRFNCDLPPSTTAPCLSEGS